MITGLVQNHLPLVSPEFASNHCDFLRSHLCIGGVQFQSTTRVDNRELSVPVLTVQWITECCLPRTSRTRCVLYQTDDLHYSLSSATPCFRLFFNRQLKSGNWHVAMCLLQCYTHLYHVILTGTFAA